MKIARSVTELMGKTPLVELGRAGKGLDLKLVGKLEYFNPCGSVKDRIGLAMISAARSLAPGGPPGLHRIQGIGAGFIPEVLDRKLVDEVIKVKDEEAVENTRVLAAEEGIFAGISSGAALSAALKIAKKKEYRGKLIVEIFPDPGERYLSTDIFE